MPSSQGMLNSVTTQHENLIPALICLALAILTIITFWPLKDCGFINLDDHIYVYENAYVQSGLNVSSIKQAFSSELAKVGHWHPLTWLSLMLDYQIFGLNPFGYHLINLLFHVMNTILLFLVLRRMTKSLWPSAFVAALFAIHPLHVESVAWITERKDVLSTFFWMLTLGAYSYYIEHRGFRSYVFVLLFFALGLLSKPMLVTLPFVLLLLDYWPLRRFSEIKPNQKVQTEILKSMVSTQSKKTNKKKQAAVVKESLEVKQPAGPKYEWSLIYPLILEKVPLFVLAILSSIVTYFAAQGAGAIHSDAIPVDIRIGNAFVSYIAYMGKMVWPSNLAVFYPHPGELIPWQVLGSVFLLIAFTLVVIWRAKKSPYLATGWLWYLGTLVPVIGFVQAGSQAMADRYTYISLIGLFIIAAWGVPDLLKKWSYRREILLASSALSILCLSIMTWTQVGYWHNSITLFDHTLKVTDNNWLAYGNRGAAYSGLGNFNQAIEDFSRAIEIKPDNEKDYNNRGNAYNGLGNYRQAIEDLKKAIEIKPAYAEAYNNRGNAYNGLGNYRQAIEDLKKAIEIKPAYAEAYLNRGNAYYGLGNYRQAIEDYGRAIEIKPAYTKAYSNRGAAYSGLGNFNQAIEDFSRAIEIKPGYADAYVNRGHAYVSLGNFKQAIDDYGKAIEIKPDYANAYYNRGIMYARSGKKKLAFNDLKTSAQLGDERAKDFLRSQGISW